MTLLLCSWIGLYSVGASKIGFLPVKPIIGILFISLGFCLTLLSKKLIIRHKIILIIIASGACFAFINGALSGFIDSAFSQFLSLTISIAIVVFSMELNRAGFLDAGSIRNTFYWTAILGVLFKLTIVFFVITLGVPVEILNGIMEYYLGVSSESIHGFGGFMGVFPRIGNAGDIFFIIVLFFFINERTGRSTIFLWLLALLLVMISYSRYLMACFIILSLYYAYQGIKDRPIGFPLLVLLVSALIYHLIDFDSVYYELLDRFTGQIQSESDSIRSEMIQRIGAKFFENVFFGIGMGGYIDNYTRSDVNLWMYETEYLALLMQFGVIGFLMVVIFYIFYFLLQFTDGCNRYRRYQAGLSLVLLLGIPMQSAIFVGTQSAIILLSIYFLSRATGHSKSLPRQPNGVHLGLLK